MPDSLNDALIETVKACGGSKVVGPELWGKSKPVDDQARKLLACLNPERPEKLSTDEIEKIGELGRERGCHVLMQFLAKRWSYAEPQPVEPQDELADLLRQYLQRHEQDKAKDDRLQRLLSQHLGVRSAA